MDAASWIKSTSDLGSAIGALNTEARARGERAEWQVVQQGSQFPTVGITLGDLRSVVHRTQPGFDRVHFAVGYTVPNRGEGPSFELGTDEREPLYIGIRIHRGAQTITKQLHQQIYEASVDRLQRATSPQLLWRPRGQFWSVWAYVPTARDGVVLSAEDYCAFVVDQALRAHAAIENLWASAAPAETGPLHSGPKNSPVTGQWEYHATFADDLGALNDLGSEGWEAFGTSMENGRSTVLLKRPR